MRPQKRRWFIWLMVSTWLLTACTTGASSSTGQTKSSAATGQDTALSALAYQPADGSLLRANQSGLARWRDGQWKNITLPATAPMSGVVVNPEQPQIVYASGLGLGVLRSDNEGTTWQAVNTNLPSLDITALALHSFKREILYAWLQDEGIYRTEDGGATWVQLPDQGPPDKAVQGLVHSTLPGSMNTGWLYAATSTGAYLSMDCF